MPKIRNIGALLTLYENLVIKIASVDARMDNIRREIYPKADSEALNKSRNSEVRRSFYATKKHENDSRTFCIISFGYYDHSHGNSRNWTDSWSNDYFTGPDDPKLWERCHWNEPYPAENSIERFAWEGGGNKIYAGYYPELEHLPREHDRLSNYNRNLWNRLAIIRAKLELSVLNAIDSNKTYYNNYRKHETEYLVRVRVHIGDRRIVTLDNGSLIVDDLYLEKRISEDNSLPADGRYSYGDGTNEHIKSKIRDEKARVNRSKTSQTV